LAKSHKSNENMDIFKCGMQMQMWYKFFFINLFEIASFFMYLWPTYYTLEIRVYIPTLPLFQAALLIPGFLLATIP
jgi:hypothetical protein